MNDEQCVRINFLTGACCISYGVILFIYLFIYSSSLQSLPSAPGSVATPVNVIPCSRIKYDDTDVMLLKVAMAVASRAEIPTQTENLPSVGCVIRRAGHPTLPSFHSLGWNGFLIKTSKSDLDGALKNVQITSTKKKDRVLASLFGLHAEDKALQYCPESLIDATVYSTHVPCYECAKRLIERGIGRVLYLFWLEGCESTIELFKSRDITCTAFGRRDLILEDFNLEVLTTRGINRGGTNTEKPPEECPYFLSSKDCKQE